MKRQGHMSQMKGQENITARDLNEREISEMLDREFKVIVIEILTRFEKCGRL